MYKLIFPIYISKTASHFGAYFAPNPSAPPHPLISDLEPAHGPFAVGSSWWLPALLSQLQPLYLQRNLTGCFSVASPPEPVTTAFKQTFHVLTRTFRSLLRSWTSLQQTPRLEGKMKRQKLQEIPFIPTVARDLRTEIPKEESLTGDKVAWKARADELEKSLYSCGCATGLGCTDPPSWVNLCNSQSALPCVPIDP